MDAQEKIMLERRTKLDKCQMRLIRARDELQCLAILFEHLQGSSCSADELRGLSVTLARIRSSVATAVRILSEIY